MIYLLGSTSDTPRITEMLFPDGRRAARGKSFLWQDRAWRLSLTPVCTQQGRPDAGGCSMQRPGRSTAGIEPPAKP